MLNKAFYAGGVALALTVVVSAVPMMAEKGKDNNGDGKNGKHGARVEHRSDVKFKVGDHKNGNKKEVRQQVRGGFDDRDDKRSDRKEDRKEAIREFKDDYSDAKGEAREVRKELRKEAREDRKDAFKEAKRDFDHDDDDLRLRLDKDFRRSVFVRGVPDSDDQFVLIRVTPDNERRLSQLFLDNRHNSVRNDHWLDRLFHRTLDVGSIIPDDDADTLRLLPLSYNAELGLPVDEDYRVGVIGNQLLLLDMDRMLVLDALRFDDEGRLLATDVHIDNERLLFYRLDDNRDAALRSYVVHHPELFDRELTLGEQIRRNALLPLGIGDVVIGRTLPVLADPVYLPPAVLADLDLPGADLKLALVGDDLVLVDPETNLVLDVVRDVV